MGTIPLLHASEPNISTAKLNSISPSLHWYNKSCAYRFVLSNCRGVAKLPASPRAEIGIITHKLLKWSSSRRVIGVSLHEAEKKFEELLTERQTELAASPLTVSIANLSKSCDVFRERRYAAIKHSECHSLPQTLNARTGSKKIYTEQSLTSPDGLVSGTMDAIYIYGEDIHVVDKKTGKVSEGGQIKGAYREQLYLYAGLIDECLGQMPVKLSLVDGDGRRWEIPFSYEHVRSNYQAAKDWLLALREEVKSNPQNVQNLAEAYPANCKYCQFRPTCKPYRKASRLNSVGFPTDFYSQVASIQTLKQATIVHFSGYDSKLSLRVTSNVLASHPILTELKAGDRIIVTNVEMIGKQLEPTISTVIFKDIRLI